MGIEAEYAVKKKELMDLTISSFHIPHILSLQNPGVIKTFVFFVLSATRPVH
jgi:hypothetical protein